MPRFQTFGEGGEVDGFVEVTFPPPPVISPAVLGFGDNSIAAGADTRFLLAWNGIGTSSLVEDSAIVAPRAGTLRRLFVRHQAAVGNGASVVYRVRVNGLNTDLTVTLATGAIVQASDLVNTQAVVAGDRITLSAVKAASIGAGAIMPIASLELT